MRVRNVQQLNARQKFILEYLREYICEHGYAPSLREIKAHVESAGLLRSGAVGTSLAAISHTLAVLEETGNIQRQYNLARSITVRQTTTEGGQSSNPNCPHERGVRV